MNSFNENKRKVILIKSNPLNRETRIPKEIKTLTDGGYLVTFLGWDRNHGVVEKYLKETENYQSILLKLKAPFGRKILFLVPIWWCFVFFHLMQTRWDIAHVINFDSIVPAVIAGKFKRKPVVYDIPDVYEDMMRFPDTLRSLILQLDKLFMRLSSGVILVDDAQIMGFQGIPNPNTIIVYDSPPEMVLKPYIDKKSQFEIFYAGQLNKSRHLNLDKLVNAVNESQGMKIIIGGCGDVVEEIKDW